MKLGTAPHHAAAKHRLDKHFKMGFYTDLKHLLTKSFYLRLSLRRRVDHGVDQSRFAGFLERISESLGEFTAGLCEISLTSKRFDDFLVPCRGQKSRGWGPEDKNYVYS